MWIDSECKANGGTDSALGSGVDWRHFMAESVMDFERVLRVPKLIGESCTSFPGLTNY